jgi:hypothetical protein
MLTWNQGFGMGRPHIRRRLRTYATAILLALAVLVVAGWSALPFLVERRLLEELRATGIAVASLNVAAVGLHETRIVDVRIGSNVSRPVRSLLYDFDTSCKRGLRASSFAICAPPPGSTPGGFSFGGLRLRMRMAEAGLRCSAVAAVPPVVRRSLSS